MLVGTVAGFSYSLHSLPAAGHRYQGDVWSAGGSKDGVLRFGIWLHPADHLHLQAGEQSS